MNILTLDTSTEACSAALCVGAARSSDYQLAVRQHAQIVLPMIERLLTAAQISLAQLDAIAFGCGPGSFTGLRIAASVTQGLALAHAIPVIAVSSLQTLAQGARREFACERVMCAIDARMHEVYWGCYQLSEGLMQLIGNEQVIAPQDLVIPENNGWYGVGTGWGSYATTMQAKFKNSMLNIAAERYPLAQDMLDLAIASFTQGNLLNPEQAIPVYLRNQVTHK